MEIIEAVGRNGQMSFNGRVLTITREGALARASQGRNRKDIPLSQISGVQLKPNTLLAAGYLAITLPGAAEQNRQGNPATDENTVVFGKKAQPGFERLRDAILAAL